MPGEETRELRVFCICGQKMRVSESMFGLPGKCVACRQKIRIPTLAELPAGVEEVYLKDHPEFLRKVKRKPATRLGPGTDDPDAIPLGDEAETVSAAILDILEPLRVVCSLDHKIQRQISSIASGSEVGDENDTKTLNGYAERIAEARAALDDQLRQRLMEVTIESSSTQEKIVQAGLSVRIGEIEFGAFRETADKLRRRRDYLQRQQQNLRGWLAGGDPHTAGGYVNVSLDSIPAEGFEVRLPPEQPDGLSLLDRHINGLREGLTRRERAERRLRELSHIQTERSMSSIVLADCRADCEAEKCRADAEVLFSRQRLEQLGNDVAYDIQAIKVCLERARERLKEGKLDEGAFAALEKKMLAVERDCAKVHDVTTRALIAGSARDLPYPKGSFLKRVHVPKDSLAAPTSVDSALALGVALVLAIVVFVPMFGGLTFVDAFRLARPEESSLRWILLGPVLAGVLVTVVSVLPRRHVRGLVFCALWLVFTVAGAAIINEGRFGMSSLANRFREGGFWLFRPSALLLAVADAGLFAAACVAIASNRKYRRVLPLAACVGLAGLLAVSTNYAGLALPDPQVSVDWNERTSGDAAYYAATVNVRNAGRRTMFVSDMQQSAHNAFVYSLARQNAAGSWERIGGPDTVEAGIETLDDYSLVPLRRGADLVLGYSLPPGNYRASLIPSASAGHRRRELFSLPPLEEPEPIALDEDNGYFEEQPAPPPPKAESEGLQAEIREPLPAGVTVELRGAIAAEGRGPRFSIILNTPADGERKLDMMLDDPITGDWYIKEYDPSRQTVTVARGQRVLILTRGQRVVLD